MADPFATALRDLHASPLAVAAVYTPVDGETWSDPFRVVRSRPDNVTDFNTSKLVIDSDSLSIQVADLPKRPSYGDRFDLIDNNGDPIELLTINGEPRLDAEAVSWVVPVQPA